MGCSVIISNHVNPLSPAVHGSMERNASVLWKWLEAVAAAVGI